MFEILFITFIHSLEFIVPQLIQLIYVTMQDLLPPDAILDSDTFYADAIYQNKSRLNLNLMNVLVYRKLNFRYNSGLNITKSRKSTQKLISEVKKVMLNRMLNLNCSSKSQLNDAWQIFDKLFIHQQLLFGIPSYLKLF